MFETLFASALIWALPAQVILIGALASGAGVAAALVAVSLSSIRLLPMVCSILPVVFGPGTPLITRMAASHYVAQTVWVLDAPQCGPPRPGPAPGLLFLDGEPRRPPEPLPAPSPAGSWPAGCPVPLDIALLMLTPVSFLLSTEKTATRFDMKLAFALGLGLLPVAHELAPLLGLGAWDMLVDRVLAGGVCLRSPAGRGPASPS